MPQSSTRTSWPPRLVTVSTDEQRAVGVDDLGQAGQRLEGAGAGLGVDDAEELRACGC